MADGWGELDNTVYDKILRLEEQAALPASGSNTRPWSS